MTSHGLSRLQMALPPKLANSLAAGSTLRCQHTVTEEVVDLQIFGVVGEWWDGLTSQDIGHLLAKNKGKAVNVSINSPGGYTLEGIAIHNLLAAHDGHVTTTVVGDASSAASHILQAGDHRQMLDTTTFMIHRTWGVVAANAGELRAIAAEMDLVDKSIAKVYTNRAGQTVAYWLAKMAGPKDKDGTMYDPEAALEDGLIDEIITTSAKNPDLEDTKKVANRNDALTMAAMGRAIRMRLVDIEAAGG